jgi:hypothetical protein
MIEYGDKAHDMSYRDTPKGDFAIVTTVVWQMKLNNGWLEHIPRDNISNFHASFDIGAPVDSALADRRSFIRQERNKNGQSRTN